MNKKVIGNIDFTGRSVQRIALQGEIMACFIASREMGVTFKELKEWVLNSQVLEIVDLLAEHIEICAALTQLQNEDGTITITGAVGTNDCLIQIQLSFFAESRH